MDLLSRIKSRDAQVGVIGLGYVGLPMSVLIAEAGFRVTGLDIDQGRVRMLNGGVSVTDDVSDARLKAAIDAGSFRAVTDRSKLADQDVILICVPTPVNDSKEPDLSYIRSATEDIAASLRPGQLVILESTTYPGTTQEVMLPLLQRDGLSVGKDFHLAFSPERLDPGNKKYTLDQVPKLVGGITEACTKAASLFYEQFCARVIKMTSATAAEMVKIYENVFRNINIAFVNEVALLCGRMGLDVWEIIDAASSKPYGFMPFYPGPGLGGHCIPVDPYYLSWKAKQYGFHVRFIDLAATVNDSMPYYVIDRVAEALNGVRKSVNGSRVVVLGVAYKRDIMDTRESPAMKIIDLLADKGAEVVYADPHVPAIRTHRGRELEAVPMDAKLAESADCAVIVTDHSDFDYEMLLARCPLIVDTRNVLRVRGNPRVVHL